MDKLIIRAKSVLIPKVLSVSPGESETILTYKPVTIRFNMPMEDFGTVYSKFNWQNVFVKANNNIINYCFSSISLNDQKTILTLIPDYSKLNDYIENVLKQPYATLEISLNNISVKSEGIELPLDENTSKFSVIYKAGKDTVAPRILDWYMTRYSITPQTELEEAKKFLKKTEDDEDFLDDAVFTNLAQGCVYLWGKVYDEESGLQRIIVKQTRKAYRLSKTINYWGLDEQREEIKEYNLSNPNVQYVRDGMGNTFFCIKIDFIEPERTGGPALFEISVEDGNGNRNVLPNPIISAVVTHNLDTVHYPSTDPFLPRNSYDNLTTILIPHNNLYNNEKAAYSLYYDYPNADSNWKGFLAGEDVIYLCEYIDKNGVKRLETFPSYEESKDMIGRSLKLNLDENNLDNASFKIIVKYRDYELWSKNCTFPKKPLVKGYTEKNGKVYLDSLSQDGNTVEVLHYTQNEGYVPGDACLSSEYALFLAAKIVSGSNLPPFYGAKAGPYHLDESSQGLSVSKPNTPVITKTTITKSQLSNRCLDIKIDVECDGENWEQVYDSLYVTCENQTNTSSKRTDKYFFSKGEETTITLESDRLFVYNSCKPKLTIYGIKSDVMSDSVTYTVDFSDDENRLNCDNMPPSTSYCGLYDSEKISVRFYDSESGAASGKVTYNEKEWDILPTEREINGKTGWCEVFIPIDDLIPGKKVLMLEVKDKADNVNFIEKVFDASSFEILRGVKYSKEEGVWKPVFDEKYREVEPLKSVNDSTYPATIYFYEFNSSWSEEPIYTVKRSSGNLAKPENITYSVSGNKFVKVRYVRKVFDWYHDNYEIYYAGSEEGSDASNLLYPTFNSKSSMAISSDAPVFIHTLVTNHSYNDCKKWTYSEWESFPKELNPQQLNFNFSSKPQRYDIPMDGADGIQSGQCYVVIAHFANGDIQMSEVMVKE